MTQTYEDLLAWAYRGEVWGEHMLERLLERGTFAGEQEHLRLLLSLESRTRRTLEQVVKAHALEVDPALARQEADDYAKKLSEAEDWHAFMQETCDIAVHALPQFELLRDLGPASATNALAETVEHEVAVLEYSNLRLAGRPQEAADAVSRHLAAWGS